MCVARVVADPRSALGPKGNLYTTRHIISRTRLLQIDCKLDYQLIFFGKCVSAISRGRARPRLLLQAQYRLPVRLEGTASSELTVGQVRE
jgi:hypothetical protein